MSGLNVKTISSFQQGLSIDWLRISLTVDKRDSINQTLLFTTYSLGCSKVTPKSTPPNHMTRYPRPPSPSSIPPLIFSAAARESPQLHTVTRPGSYTLGHTREKHFHSFFFCLVPHEHDLALVWHSVSIHLTLDPSDTHMVSSHCPCYPCHWDTSVSTREDRKSTWHEHILVWPIGVAGVSIGIRQQLVGWERDTGEISKEGGKEKNVMTFC